VLDTPSDSPTGHHARDGAGDEADYQADGEVANRQSDERPENDADGAELRDKRPGCLNTEQATVGLAPHPLMVSVDARTTQPRNGAHSRGLNRRPTPYQGQADPALGMSRGAQPWTNSLSDPARSAALPRGRIPKRTLTLLLRGPQTMARRCKPRHAEIPGLPQMGVARNPGARYF